MKAQNDVIMVLLALCALNISGFWGDGFKVFDSHGKIENLGVLRNKIGIFWVYTEGSLQVRPEAFIEEFAFLVRNQVIGLGDWSPSGIAYHIGPITAP